MQIQLSRYVGPDAQLTASGLPEGADALAFTKAVRRDKKPALFIARDDARAAAFNQRAGFSPRIFPLLCCRLGIACPMTAFRQAEP